MPSDAQLVDRGIATALACWAENVRGSSEAKLATHPGVTVAVFPTEPERGFFNNAILHAGLPRPEVVAAIEAMERDYADAAITEFAAWVLEDDQIAVAELASRGFRVNESTCAMGLELDTFRAPEPQLEVTRGDWAEYVRILDVPGFLPTADPSAYHVVVGRLDGANVGSAMAYDHDGDCGIYNVGTEEGARRHGVGAAMTVRLLLDARARGCRTATLQSTPMGENVYASLGFRRLARILEFVPSANPTQPATSASPSAASSTPKTSVPVTNGGTNVVFVSGA